MSHMINIYKKKKVLYTYLKKRSLQFSQRILGVLLGVSDVMLI